MAPQNPIPQQAPHMAGNMGGMGGGLMGGNMFPQQQAMPAATPPKQRKPKKPAKQAVEIIDSDEENSHGFQIKQEHQQGMGGPHEGMPQQMPPVPFSQQQMQMHMQGQQMQAFPGGPPGGIGGPPGGVAPNPQVSLRFEIF